MSRRRWRAPDAGAGAGAAALAITLAIALAALSLAALSLAATSGQGARRADTVVSPAAPSPTLVPDPFAPQVAAASTPVETAPSAVSSAIASAVESRANAAFARLLAVYWDDASRSFFSRSDHRPLPGVATRFSGFWQSAEIWETVIDRFERTRSADDRALLDRVYDGFVARYPTFDSDWNDDVGWWALGSMHAYELTHEGRYLSRARSLFERIWHSWDGTYGGGLWWRRSVHDQKNVATNAPAAMTAVRLYRATGNTAYLTRARALFAWVDGHLRSGRQLNDHIEGAGRVVTWQFTYDYGTYVGAGRELYHATGNASYLGKAAAAADAVVARVAPGGVLQAEGQGDGGGFKGILVRNLVALSKEPGLGRFASFIRSNADAAWSHRRSDGLAGPDWTTRPGAGPIESLTFSSAVAVLEAATR